MAQWRWAAASRCGTAHADLGTRRQDAYRVLAHERFLVAVACDGAGSSSHGGSGAAITARLLSHRARGWVEDHGALPAPGTVETWVGEVRSAIAACAADRACNMADFATTVVMAVSNGTSTLTMHIGDGAVVGRDHLCELLELSWPEGGAYAATTFFITDAVPHIRISVIEDHPVSGLVLLTDGLERLALDFQTGLAHRGFFQGLLTAVDADDTIGRAHQLSAQLGNFLDSDGVNARTDDDKTLILAVFE